VAVAVNKVQNGLSLINSIVNHEEIAEAKQDLMAVVDADQKRTIQNCETLKTRLYGTQVLPGHPRARRISFYYLNIKYRMAFGRYLKF
jgi:hypothetical protein